MATRNEYQRKVKHHIQDLIKRGIDPNLVTEGKTIESLGWNIRTYNSFMERKRIVLRKEQRKQRENKIVYVNSQGYEFTKKEYDRVKKLQDKFNKKLEQEYKKFIKINGSVDELTEAFLKGEPIRHVNGDENIQLQEHFGKVNLLDRINEGVDLDVFEQLTNDKIKSINYEQITDDQSDYFEKDMLNPLVESLDLHKKEKDMLLDEYKRLDIISRIQFNKDMKRIMKVIEYEEKNPQSSSTPYYIIRSFMSKNHKREFIVSY